MRKISLVILSAMFLFIAGCASNWGVVDNDPKQAEYIAKVDAFPLEFTIPNDAVADAWGRAQSFIGRFSNLKLQTATDYVIQTYTSTGDSTDCSYTISKTPLKDNVQITVESGIANWFMGGVAKRNAHILAYYISTGELPYPKLIK